MVWLDGSAGRFYLDACGSLAAVYCARQGLLASTPSLVPSDKHNGPRVELVQAIGFPFRQGSYPAGLTPRHGIDRLLPNHYLDLGKWQPVRHWPKDPLAASCSTEDAIAEISMIVKRQIRAVVTTTPTYLMLTAGKDSRMLLACARDLADRLEMVTANHDDEIAEIDCHSARQIASRFGFKHRVLSMVAATQDDLEEWTYRTGCCVGEVRGWQGARMYKGLRNGHATLLGTVGELARGYWWGADDNETTVIAPERLVALCKCPPHAELIARARAWLDGVPTTNALDTLALFLLEQDCGCWAAAWAYADCDYGYDLFPLSHRRIIECMLALPVSYRRSGNLQRDIIAREWPELLAWPFNQESGLRRVLGKAKRVSRRHIASALQIALSLASRVRGTIQTPGPGAIDSLK